MFQVDSRDYLDFQTSQSRYWPTRLVPDAINSVSAFDTVSRKILHAQLATRVKLYLDDVRAKCPKSGSREVELDMQPGVRRFVIEYLQNIDHELPDVEMAGATISGQKSSQFRCGVEILSWVCGEAGRWLQASNVDKVGKWPMRENRPDCSPGLRFWTRFWIWIPTYAMVAGPLIQMLCKDIECEWETKQKRVTAILRDTLCSTPALQTLGNSDSSWYIVVRVDAISVGSGSKLQQTDDSEDWKPWQYATGICNNAENRYDVGNR